MSFFTYETTKIEIVSFFNDSIRLSKETKEKLKRSKEEIIYLINLFDCIFNFFYIYFILLNY